MNSLGNCRAEFSGWRFTQLCLVPRQVMDMEKLAIISDPDRRHQGTRSSGPCGNGKLGPQFPMCTGEEGI